MSETALTSDIRLECTAECIHVELGTPCPTLSSAVLNGGLVDASHILNLNVKNQWIKEDDSNNGPAVMLCEYIQNQGWAGKTVGMMTAADMESFRIARAAEQGVEIFVLATAGLSNARRAGDHAEHRELGRPLYDPGTINLVCLTTARLSRAAMVEAVITTTEAKTLALRKLGIRSPVSNKPATGTGTDAVVIVSGHGQTRISYCGKHVVFGEILANLVMDAVCSSIKDR